jgi:hypothetical protein
MAAGIPQVPSVENVSTTLSAGITDSASTMSVADASNLTFPCYLVIDRVDASGTVKSTSLWEYVKVTNISGNDLTITRGQGGSTQQSHSSGAVVEAVITAAHFEEWYDVLNPEHTAAGGHVITGTMTVAGMNLASVATIASASFTHLNANASYTGLGVGVFPTFVMPNNASTATVSIGKPLTMPRAGTARFVNVTLRAPVSAASVIWDINKNYTSIFDAGTRPSILGGGTFVSTASIATSNFKAGDTVSVDLDAGGEFKDATLTIGMY